jgi:hypothetical protein
MGHIYSLLPEINLTAMDTEHIIDWFRYEEFVSDMEIVINRFNGEVFKDVMNRHDIPADIRIVLEKYRAISMELVECLALATDADSLMMTGVRKEDS